MKTFHRRAIKLPKGTRTEHLILRPQPAYGSQGRVVVLKNGKEIGHFLLSVRHRHLFLGLKSPASGSAERPIRTGAAGWVASAGAKVGRLRQKLGWMCQLMVVLVRICFSLACIRKPAVGDWKALDGLWGCPFGTKTWADWKNIPIFYILYDWLLGLLEDALSPFERPHSITITAAWQHTLCVAILGSGIFFVAACRLGWILLVYCYKGHHSYEAHLPSKHPLLHHMARHGGMIHADADPGASHRHMRHADSAFGDPTHAGSDFSVTHHGHVPHADSNHVTLAGPSRGNLKKAGEPGDTERRPATPSHPPQHLADGNRPPAAAFKELGEKASHEGKSSGGATSAEAKHKGIAAGRDVHFQEQPDSVGPNTPHKSGKHAAPDHVNATPADTPKGHPLPLLHPHNESTTPQSTNMPEEASFLDLPGTPDAASPSESSETLEDAPSSDVPDAPEDVVRKARLAEMRTALEEAGVETVSRADARIVSLQAENERLHLLLASSLAQLAAAQQGGGYFRRLLTLTAEARVSELTADSKSLHAALEQTALVRDRREAAFVQATKMRSLTEQHLVKTRVQRDALLQALQQYEHQEDTGSSAVPTGDSALTSTATRDLESKDQVIMQQAAAITNHALKTSGQTLKLQQLQTQLRARELAWLLFEIRLVPTRGFKNGQYDMPYNAKQIDEGGSAQIYLETLYGERHATKYPKKGAEAVGELAHELRMHLRCAGPKTVKILSVGMDKVPRGPMLSADVMCFSMELASQSLKAYIGQATGGFKGSNREGLTFELAHTKFILRQVVQAMQGVHGHATLHGDVKPDNFLVFMHEDSAQLESVKITDFGLARDLMEGCHHITPTNDGTRGTQVLSGLSPLLFREAKSNDDFAANAKCIPALDFKVRRQEVSIDGDEDSLHADTSPVDSHASDSVEHMDHADVAIDQHVNRGYMRKYMHYNTIKKSRFVNE
ncbi:hypothetical protein WJX82_000446 [Trebouxia sp. C0006]